MATKTLYQCDFARGTVRITTPGTYKLAEDIEFNPNPANDFNPEAADLLPCGEYASRAYSLGFFAAITIECSDVVLDLGGKTLKQSKAFNTQQRFFSCIEISKAPFITGQGPNDFGENDELVSNVVIKDGQLGLTSHHGIHGNTMDNVEILNVHISQFEVAGISLNGAKRLLIANCIVGNSVASVPISSAYSQARFLHPILKQLVLEDGERCVTIRGQHIPIKTIYASLVTEMNATFVEIMTDKPVASAVFKNRNASMLSDGNAYGILVNRKGLAVGDFVDDLDFESADAAHSVIIRNTRVERINSEAIEIRGLQYMAKARAVAAGEENEGYGDAGVVTDPVGAVFDFERVSNPVHRTYEGNVLSNAQLAVGKYEAEPKRSYMPEEVLQWAACGGPWTHDDTFTLTTGSDSMGHTMKGNLGVFMSGVACVSLVDINIRDIYNSAADHAEAASSKGMNTCAVCLTTCRDVVMCDVKATDVYSKHFASAFNEVTNVDRVIKHQCTESNIYVI